MKTFAQLAVFLMLTSSAGAQGLVTPQDFTNAGAGGPVSGTIPHGVTYPSPPPVNNGLSNQPAVTPSLPIPANTSQAINRIPIITPPTLKMRPGSKKKRSNKETEGFDLKDGGTPSIMIESEPGQSFR